MNRFPTPKKESGFLDITLIVCYTLLNFELQNKKDVMILDTLKQWNWIDIFVVILVFRICYVAIKNGFPAELFKFLGTVTAIYLSLHYYMGLSNFIKARLGSPKLSLEFLYLFSFVVLALIGCWLFVFLRQSIFRLIKIEAVSVLNKWLGLFLGVARGFLTCGLIIFMLVVSNADYLKKSAGDSYSGMRLFKLAANTYAGLWYGLMSKFMSGEKFNETISEVEASLAKK